MGRALPVLVLFAATLSLLAGGATWVVRARMQSWAEEDMSRRAALAVNGARWGFERLWSPGGSRELERVLLDLTRDERLDAAAACADGVTLGATPTLPKDARCELLAGVLPERGESVVSAQVALQQGRVHVSRVALGPTGRSVLVLHDVSWLDSRQRELVALLWGAFGALGFAAGLSTLFVVRRSMRGFADEVKALLTGRPPPGGSQFSPLLADVRGFYDELKREQDQGDGADWSPARLKSVVEKHLDREPVLVVANREPYIHTKQADGSVVVQHPASGLVTALEPVMRACGGAWVAHGSGSADVQNSDAKGRLSVPPGEGSYTLRRVWLSKEEEQGYYYGFSNEGLWPLCHLAFARPEFRSDDWRWYQEVNQRFADAVADEAGRDDPVVLVQDYHFALLPKLVRERLPKATVLTFWHVPWPAAERFGICPWRDELLEGMLGSSIMGFHTQQHCNNFLDACDRYLEARLDRERNAVVRGGHSTLVRPYPISVEWPSRWAAEAPPVVDCRKKVFEKLGLKPNALLGVGVDRLDYTKGIEERIQAVERLLERYPELQGRFVFAQIAAPSRSAIPAYQALHDRVDALATRINEKFQGPDGYRPIHLLREHHEPPKVFEFYRAADLLYVSSLHDGMNLVAKEFVAARDDEQGALVLSHFAGASRELTQALVVNPYDLDEAAAALHTALVMPQAEQKTRMRAMRAQVKEFNVYRWAGRLLIDAGRIKRRELK